MGKLLIHPTFNRVVSRPRETRLSVTFGGVSHGAFATQQAARSVAAKLVGKRPRFRECDGHTICIGSLGVAHIERVAL